jgi:hypothetical protein
LSPPSGVAAGEDIGPVRESGIDSQGEEAVERLREGERKGFEAGILISEIHIVASSIM